MSDNKYYMKRWPFMDDWDDAHEANENRNYQWDLVTAVSFIRELEEHVQGKYHVALTGSCLYKGASFDDLDIIIYPHNSHHCSEAEVTERLTSFGMVRTKTSDEVKEYWETKSNGETVDTKHVEKWVWQGRPVDVFHWLLAPQENNSEG